MDALIIVVLGLLGIVAASTLGARIGVAAPLILVMAGIVVSLLPFVPAVDIDPEWILAGVLPPLLYSASVSMPSMEFRRDFGAIVGLSVLLVVVSALVLGVFFSWVIPGLGIWWGIALGAIVSPTGSVATSIVKKASGLAAGGVDPRRRKPAQRRHRSGSVAYCHRRGRRIGVAVECVGQVRFCRRRGRGHRSCRRQGQPDGSRPCHRFDGQHGHLVHGAVSGGDPRRRVGCVRVGCCSRGRARHRLRRSSESHRDTGCPTPRTGAQSNWSKVRSSW